MSLKMAIIQGLTIPRFTIPTRRTGPFNSSTFVSSDRSVVGAIYNTIAVDVSEINLVHAKVNENGQYQETVKSDLHYCLSTEAI